MNKVNFMDNALLRKANLEIVKLIFKLNSFSLFCGILSSFYLMQFKQNLNTFLKIALKKDFKEKLRDYLNERRFYFGPNGIFSHKLLAKLK